MIETKDVGSLHDLVQLVLDTVKSRNVSQLWYRGLSSENHELIPKIMRDGKSSRDVFEREVRLLTRFRQRSLPFWANGSPQNNWEQLFAMQHYGLPTRLLDWSENLFVAVYFALKPEQLEESDKSSPILWVLDPVSWNRSTPLLSEFGSEVHVLTTVDEWSQRYEPGSSKKPAKSPVAIFGSHNSPRIVAQRGTFMVWGEEPKPLEHFAAQSAEPLLWRYRFTRSRTELYRELQALGFGESMVFPELQSLCTELSRVEGWRA